MKKQKVSFSTILFVIIFFVGLSVLLYPSVSNYINQKNSTRAIAAYDAAVADMDKKDYDDYFEKAEEYNEALNENRNAFFDPDLLDGYEDTLDITGTGIMGYVSIDKIDVTLPIYHGTDEGVLESGAGHLEGTSFPIGGENTHAVISAHRGLPSAKLFTNLDEMEVGDTFTITILDRVMTYEVDLISIVLPDETELTQIEDGKDYCTLMTCTPYGINTHRLLVRGHRIGTSELSNLSVTSDAYQIEPIVIAPIMAVPLLLILMIWLVFHSRKKNKRGETHEED